jgi:hypothetical protein
LTVRIEVFGETAGEALEKLRTLAGGLLGAAASPAKAETPAPLSAPISPPFATTAAARRGRPSKDKAPAAEKRTFTIYGEDGQVFTTVKTAEGAVETLGKQFDTISDTETMDRFEGANGQLIDELPDDLRAKISDAIDAARTRIAQAEAAADLGFEDAPSAVTFEQLTAAARALQDAKGAVAAQALVKSLGVQKLRDIPQEKWAEAVAAFEAATAAKK